MGELVRVVNAAEQLGLIPVNTDNKRKFIIAYSRTGNLVKISFKTIMEVYLKLTFSGKKVLMDDVEGSQND